MFLALRLIRNRDQRHPWPFYRTFVFAPQEFGTSDGGGAQLGKITKTRQKFDLKNL
jgi:hypothetical protein